MSKLWFDMEADAFDLESVKQKLASFFARREEVAFAYLFGSCARERVTSLSDIDVAVFVIEKLIRESRYPYGYASHLTSELMSALQTNRVDLVILNEAPPALKYNIFTHGTPIFCRDRELERQVYVNAFHHYQDTAPLRQTQHHYFVRYLRNLGAPASHGQP